LSGLNPPPELLEFKHPNGKDGPDLTDRRKAMIEQIHFQNSRPRKSTPAIRTKLARLSVRCQTDLAIEAAEGLDQMPQKPPKHHGIEQRGTLTKSV
jgi:hypothetical protein